VARAFREALGLTELYLADLDAIAGAEPTWAVYARLRADGFQLWVDGGVRQAADALRLHRAGIERVIVGLETLAGPAELSELCSRLEEAIVFSLDLREGRPLGRASAWPSADPWAIAEQAVAAGVRRVLVLDLTRVGMGQGTGTEQLCAAIRAAFPEVSVLAGGGIRCLADLQKLDQLGVEAALVASALHDGQLTRADLDRLRRPPFPGR
jgi:phosphoribosylformimino-5-aminoimidazole carboxamide ribotide isomerase